MKTTNTPSSASDEFLAKKAEFDAMLTRLQKISATNFNTNNVNWGHVGTLGHFNKLLSEITEAAYCEGEYAK